MLGSVGDCDADAGVPPAQPHRSRVVVLIEEVLDWVLLVTGRALAVTRSRRIGSFRVRKREWLPFLAREHGRPDNTHAHIVAELDSRTVAVVGRQA